MIKNHPFENGNKRIAVMTMLLFLFKNKKWLRASNDELYAFAKIVAASEPKNMNVEMQRIIDFLGAKTITLNQDR